MGKARKTQDIQTQKNIQQVRWARNTKNKTGGSQTKKKNKTEWRKVETTKTQKRNIETENGMKDDK